MFSQIHTYKEFVVIILAIITAGIFRYRLSLRLRGYSVMSDQEFVSEFHAVYGSFSSEQIVEARCSVAKIIGVNPKILSFSLRLGGLLPVCDFPGCGYDDLLEEIKYMSEADKSGKVIGPEATIGEIINCLLIHKTRRNAG